LLLTSDPPTSKLKLKLHTLIPFRFSLQESALADTQIAYLNLRRCKKSLTLRVIVIMRCKTALEWLLSAKPSFPPGTPILGRSNCMLLIICDEGGADIYTFIADVSCPTLKESCGHTLSKSAKSTTERCPILFNRFGDFIERACLLERTPAGSR
jgi:hypothetical protein